ncbi:MAG: hypothetical protein AAFY71_24175 [Bacteroidota bacterium]
MEAEELFGLLKTSFERPLNGEEVNLLQALQKEHPYFTLPRILQCKSLDGQNLLKKQIAYIPKRSQLRDFLNGKLYFAEIENDASMENDSGRKPYHVLFPPHPFDQFSILNGLGRPHPDIDFKDALSITYQKETSKTIPFLQNVIFEKVSKYIHIVDDIRSELASRYTQDPARYSKAVKADHLVNEFLEKLPQIGPPKIAPLAQESTQMEHEAARKSVEFDNENFVSETLAKLHIKQNNISEAIRIYELLCLRFPEKSSYFEAQLDKLKQ